MNVILVGADLKKRNLVAIADIETDSPQHRIHLVRDDGTAVLCRTNRVVQQHRDVVTFVDVFAHANNHTELGRKTGNEASFGE